jgi:uncharacterized glyoxalase superfamily protein PhnB
MGTARKIERFVSPVPEGYHTVTSCLAVKGADRAIEFYAKAFGGKLIDRMYASDGKTVIHASLAVGDSRLFLCDDIPGFGVRAPQSVGGATSSFYLYVEDADAAFGRAVKAGATAVHEPMDAFWGDRCGTVRDPFGYQWDLATHVEDVPPDEMKRRGDAFLKEMEGKK